MTHPPTQFYDWQGYRCAYEVWSPQASGLPLLLIHPIGVGLSRRFWQRFCQAWPSDRQPIYSPDLLGCGDSDMPRIAYRPEDWADQLQHFLDQVIQTPVVVVVQGALLPVAIALSQRSHLIRGLILAGPPAWAVMTLPTPNWQSQVSWNLLFDSPLGAGFYQYARRRPFLQSFSARQLFADAQAVDADWLDTLQSGAKNPASRYAVFAFLAGFWRRNWQEAIAQIQSPTLVVLGNTASSISRSGQSDNPEQRMADYLAQLPQGQGIQIPGRNVLPYESTPAFVEAIAPFIAQL